MAATFTGHIYDTVLDIYHAEARFYDAKNRQWMSTDPIKDGLNWYQYVGANPVTYFDPTGLAMQPPVPPPPPPPRATPEEILKWATQTAQWEAQKWAYNNLDFLFTDEEHAIGGIIHGASGGAADTISGIVSTPIVIWDMLTNEATYNNAKQFFSMSISERFELLSKVPDNIAKSAQNDYYNLVSWWENEIVNGTAYSRTKAGTSFVFNAAIGWAIGNAFTQLRITQGGLKGLDAVDGYFPQSGCPLALANAWGTTDDLVRVATAQGKGGITPVGRAFQKHAGDPTRAGTFVGEVTGNAAKNTQQGVEYLNRILQNPESSYTVRSTTAFGEVLDVRLPDGMGARWTFDGSKFIGFLERYTN